MLAWMVDEHRLSQNHRVIVDEAHTVLTVRNAKVAHLTIPRSSACEAFVRRLRALEGVVAVQFRNLSLEADEARHNKLRTPSTRIPSRRARQSRGR